MFCSSCGMEYRAGYWSCSDCNEDLVDALPEDGLTRDPAETMTGVRVVFVSSSGIEANLVKTLLEGSGITVYALDENVNTSLFAGAGVKLAVQSYQEQWARVVLSEYRVKEASSTATGSTSPVPFNGRVFSQD